MDYRLVYTKSSQQDLEKLDDKIAKRILTKMKEFLSLEDPLIKAKKLKGFEIDTYRFRVGDYRVIFRLDPKNGKLVVLVVLKIAHRREVYKGEI